MIFNVGSLIALRAAYSVVVLPLPVGPVTSRMPCGIEISSRNFDSTASGMPTVLRSNFIRSLSKSRRTTPSPYSMGMIETRTSISRPETLILIRPSCGSRFSAMLSRDMIFNRVTMAA